MLSQTAVLVVLAGLAVAAPSNTYTAPHQPSYDQRRPYTYDYAVKDDYSGVDFGQNEESHGQVTSGSYTVQLPDGRRQTVTYTVDGYNGYVADVQYYGEAQFPHEYGPAVTFPPQSYGHHEPSYH